MKKVSVGLGVVLLLSLFVLWALPASSSGGQKVSPKACKFIDRMSPDLKGSTLSLIGAIEEHAIEGGKVSRGAFRATNSAGESIIVVGCRVICTPLDSGPCPAYGCVLQSDGTCSSFGCVGHCSGSCTRYMEADPSI